jgi:TorA maturation chaperone TorD
MATLETEPAPLTTCGTAIELLAHFWSRPLPEEVAQWTAWAEVAATCNQALLPSGSPAAPAPDPTVAAGELLDEYERLFVGPGPVPCPPYESYWRMDVSLDVRQSLMGPCVGDLRTIYAAMGIEPAADAGELPDYVASEFEALAYALASGHMAPAKALLDEHLLRWLPRLCREVTRHGEVLFYRDLASLTLAWVPAVRRELGNDEPG